MRLLNSTLVFNLLLLLMPLPVFAQEYSQVEYVGGYPGFQSKERVGTLSILEDSITFKNEANTSFTMPYTSLNGYGYTRAKKKGYGLLLAGPNPIALAASAGISAVGLVGSRIRNKKSHCRLSFNYRDTDGKVREVTFKLPDEFVQNQIVGDMALRMNQYQQARRALPPLEPQVYDLRTPEEPGTEKELEQ